jgi:hypothetical protein
VIKNTYLTKDMLCQRRQYLAAPLAISKYGLLKSIASLGTVGFADQQAEQCMRVATDTKHDIGR